jgi:uncharacterized protein
MIEVLSRAHSDFFAATDIWHVRSAAIDDVFRICVSMPERCDLGGAAPEAVYVTDAESLAGSLIGLTRSCAMSGELPALATVAVGYPLDAEPVHQIRRIRDLAPTARPDLDTHVPNLLRSSAIVASGGADSFLDFLIGIVALVETEYALDPARRTLAGHSLGGSFSLHALLKHPAVFQRYLAISPALWWDGREIFGRLRTAIATGSAPTAEIFLCTGEFENPKHLRAIFESMPDDVQRGIPENVRNVDLQGDMRAMHEMLASWDPIRLAVTAKILADESHNSIAGAGLSHGLRALFGTRPASIPQSKDGS